MTNRSQKSAQENAICHLSFVIGHLSFLSLRSRRPRGPSALDDLDLSTVLQGPMAGHNNLGSRRDSLADFDLPGPLISKQHFGSLGRIAVGNEHVGLAVFLDHSFLGDQDCIGSVAGLDFRAPNGPWL